MPDETTLPADEQQPDVESTEEKPLEEEFPKDEFDYDRAMKTIRAQRDEVKDFKRQMAEYKQQVESLSPYQQAVNALQSDDPKVRAAALEALGLEEDADEETEFESVEDRLDRFEQEREQERRERQAALEQQEQVEQLEAAIEDLEEKEGIQLSDPEFEFIALKAMRGVDVKEAFDSLRTVGKTYHERLVESKRAQQVPGGKPGSQKIDTKDDDARVEALARFIEAAQSD